MLGMWIQYVEPRYHCTNDIVVGLIWSNLFVKDSYVINILSYYIYMSTGLRILVKSQSLVSNEMKIADCVLLSFI